MMLILRRFITNPLATIDTFAKTFSPKRDAWLVIALVALQGAGFGGGFVLRWIFWFFLAVFCYTMAAIFMDVVAQFLGHKSQLTRLFYWLPLATLPRLLKTPFEMIYSHSSPILLGFWELASFAILVAELFLLFRTVRIIYDASSRSAIAILAAPALIIFGAFFFLSVAAFTAIAGAL